MQDRFERKPGLMKFVPAKKLENLKIMIIIEFDAKNANGIKQEVEDLERATAGTMTGINFTRMIRSRIWTMTGMMTGTKTWINSTRMMRSYRRMGCARENGQGRRWEERRMRDSSNNDQHSLRNYGKNSYSVF